MNAARMLLRLEKTADSRPLLNDYRAYSALLGLIKKQSASFSEYLHDLKVKAMNAVLCGAKNGSPSIEITSLSKQVSESLYETLSAVVSSEDRIWLGNTTFKASAVIPAEPGIGSGNYGFFVLDDNIKIHRKFSLSFKSSCVFKNGDTKVFFPEPWFVFNSLLKKWNYFSDKKIEPFSRMSVEQNLRVVKYDLKTKYVAKALGEKKSFTGFLGHCDYEINRKAPEDFALAVNMLMSLAPFAGLGKSTAMGMGRVAINI